MSDPAELFENVINETMTVRGQFNHAEPIDERPKSPKNKRMSKSDRDNEDGIASAKIALAMEVMRRENSEARAELRSTMSAFQAENALFRETIRGFISSSQVENAQFREQIKEAVAGVKVELSGIKSDMANHSKDIESKISGLKIWVLTGTIAALVAALTLVGGALIRSFGGTNSSPAKAETMASEAGPSIHLSFLVPADAGVRSPPPAGLTTEMKVPIKVAPVHPPTPPTKP